MLLPERSIINNCSSFELLSISEGISEVFLGKSGNGFQAKKSWLVSRLEKKSVSMQSKLSVHNFIWKWDKSECSEISTIHKAGLTSATNLKNWSVVGERPRERGMFPDPPLGWCAWENSCSQWPAGSEVFHYTNTLWKSKKVQINEGWSEHHP